MRACVCSDGRSPKVLRPRLVFQITQKPGGVGDSSAEAAWTTTANGLNVQLRRSTGSLGNDCTHLATEIKQGDRSAHLEMTART